MMRLYRFLYEYDSNSMYVHCMRINCGTLSQSMEPYDEAVKFIIMYDEVVEFVMSYDS